MTTDNITVMTNLPRCIVTACCLLYLMTCRQLKHTVHPVFDLSGGGGGLGELRTTPLLLTVQFGPGGRIWQSRKSQKSKFVVESL